MRKRRIASIIFAALVAVPLVARAAPQILFWPHHAQLAGFDVYANAPISPQLASHLAAAKSRLQAQGNYDVPIRKKLFLTDGGWRWNLLALRSYRAFAISLPITEAIIVNQSDQPANRISLSPKIHGVGGVRSLDGVIAHELTHGYLRKRFGYIKITTAPNWLIEGYCDYVANESSLNAADVAQLRARRQDHPALVYYDGRQKISTMIAQQHLTVEEIFARF